MIKFTAYLKFRAELRGYELSEIENILRFSMERYFDVSTQRLVFVGETKGQIVLIPYELIKKEIVPITIHSITRQQINFRIKTGRFKYE